MYSRGAGFFFVGPWLSVSCLSSPYRCCLATTAKSRSNKNNDIVLWRFSIISVLTRLSFVDIRFSPSLPPSQSACFIWVVVRFIPFPLMEFKFGSRTRDYSTPSPQRIASWSSLLLLLILSLLLLSQFESIQLNCLSRFQTFSPNLFFFSIGRKIAFSLSVCRCLFIILSFHSPEKGKKLAVYRFL